MYGLQGVQTLIQQEGCVVDEHVHKSDEVSIILCLLALFNDAVVVHGMLPELPQDHAHVIAHTELIEELVGPAHCLAICSNKLVRNSKSTRSHTNYTVKFFFFLIIDTTGKMTNSYHSQMNTFSD